MSVGGGWGWGGVGGGGVVGGGGGGGFPGFGSTMSGAVGTNQRQSWQVQTPGSTRRTPGRG